MAARRQEREALSHYRALIVAAANRSGTLKNTSAHLPTQSISRFEPPWPLWPVAAACGRLLEDSDPQAAREWYERAATGHPDATNELSRLLEGTDRQAPQ